VAGPAERSVPDLAEMHQRFAGPLFVYALRRVGDRGTAEEIVQDTLVRAWKGADRFAPRRGGLAPWLFTIAHNLPVDRSRRSAARPRLVGPPDEQSDPIDVSDVDRALESWQIAEALAELSEEHRRAIVEVHYLGYQVREAAERAGVPEGTVKSRLYYGLRALRLKLEERGVMG